MNFSSFYPNDSQYKAKQRQVAGEHKMKKHALLIITTALMVLAGWWIYSTTTTINQQIEQTQSQQVDQPETAKASNIHIVETENGKKIWELTADKAVYENENAQLTNVKGKFFDDNNEILVTFEAPVGNYVEQIKKVSLQKGASVIHPRTETSIESEEMFWTGGSDNITAHGNVKVVKKNLVTSHADKSIFTTDFDSIKLEGNTYSEINISGKV